MKLECAQRTPLRFIRLLFCLQHVHVFGKNDHEHSLIFDLDGIFVLIFLVELNTREHSNVGSQNNCPQKLVISHLLLKTKNTQISNTKCLPLLCSARHLFCGLQLTNVQVLLLLVVEHWPGELCEAVLHVSTKHTRLFQSPVRIAFNDKTYTIDESRVDQATLLKGTYTNKTRGCVGQWLSLPHLSRFVPSFDKVCPVGHDGLGQHLLGACERGRERVDAVGERRAEQVRDVVSVHAARPARVRVEPRRVAELVHVRRRCKESRWDRNHLTRPLEL